MGDLVQRSLAPLRLLHESISLVMLLVLVLFSFKLNTGSSGIYSFAGYAFNPLTHYFP